MSNAQMKAEDMTPDNFWSATLGEADPAINEAIEKELDRQQYSIELIPSENIVSKAGKYCD